jgi:hypothetical protein
MGRRHQARDTSLWQQSLRKVPWGQSVGRVQRPRGLWPNTSTEVTEARYSFSVSKNQNLSKENFLHDCWPNDNDDNGPGTKNTELSLSEALTSMETQMLQTHKNAIWKFIWIVIFIFVNYKKKGFKFSFLFSPSGSPHGKYWLKQKLKLKIYKFTKNRRLLKMEIFLLPKDVFCKCIHLCFWSF